MSRWIITRMKGNFMQKSKLLVAMLGALAAMPALANEEGGSGFSGEVTLVSNYVYRGISQTGGKPGIQGAFDYEHSSGFYAGVEAMSSSFFSDLYTETAGVEGASNASLELDIFVGFKNEFAEDFHYDVGFLGYNFPGNYAPGATKGNTDEIYGAIGYKWVTAKYSYSLGKTFGVPGAKGTNYFEINADFPVADGLTVSGHVGKQTYKGVDAAALVAAGRNPSYSDYKIGINKELGGFDLGLAYSKTNAPVGAGTFYHVLNRDLGKGAFIASISHSF